MADNRLNVNLTERASEQLADLETIYGTKTAAVLAAIDDLWRQKYNQYWRHGKRPAGREEEQDDE